MKKLLALLLFSTTLHASSADKAITNPDAGGDIVIQGKDSVGTLVEFSRFSPPLGDIARSVGTVGAVANSQGALAAADFTTPTNSHWWSLDTNSNDATTGTAINLTQNGSPAFNGVGFFNREALIDFDGVDNYLSSANAAFNVTTGSFTVGGWLKNSNAATYLFSKWNDTTNRQYLFYTDTNNSANFLLSTNGSAISTNLGYVNPNVAVVGQWMHYVAVFDNPNNLAKIYINGQLAASATETGDLFSSNATFAINAYQNGGAFSLMRQAQVQDVFFTSDVLTDAQINAIYSHRFTNTAQVAAGHVLAASSFPFTTQTSNKVTFWNLSDVLDGSGNGNTLTNNGSTPFTGLDIFGVAQIAKLNGSSQYLSSAAANFNPGNTSFSYGGWFAADNWLGNGQLIGNTGGTHVWRLYYDASGILPYYGTNATTVGYISTANLVHGSWHHLAVSFDAGAARWETYLDGALVQSYSGGNTAAGSTFCIGSHSGSQFYKGRVQSAFFVNSALTQADIRKLYSAKITHSKNIAAQNQNWFSSWLREDSKLALPLENGWMVDMNANNLYVDFSDLNPGDYVTIKAK